MIGVFLKDKGVKYINSAHLFAIACKLSWEVGNEGFVQFLAKTKLIEHYQKTLNAQIIGGQSMMIDSVASLHLVKKYFKEVDW